MFYFEESGYIKLLNDLISSYDTNLKLGRNGTTISMFGNNYKFNLKNGFPILTTKKVSFKNIYGELLWFLKGQTDAKLLEKDNINIWKGNSSREFLDSHGLYHYADGECGPIYGWQWRNFNATYPNKEYLGVDQLRFIIEEIKKGSRRAVLSAWNPSQYHEMALPPCHILYIFYVNNGELSCHLTMRSSDTFLGLPYNIASTALLTHILAKVTGLIPNEICIAVCDAHLYTEHIEVAKEQIKRNIYEKPTLVFNKNYETSDDPMNWIESLTLDDIILKDYKHGEAIKANMIA